MILLVLVLVVSEEQQLLLKLTVFSGLMILSDMDHRHHVISVKQFDGILYWSFSPLVLTGGLTDVLH